MGPGFSGAAGDPAIRVEGVAPEEPFAVFRGAVGVIVRYETEDVGITRAFIRNGPVTAVEHARRPERSRDVIERGPIGIDVRRRTAVWGLHGFDKSGEFAEDVWFGAEATHAFAPGEVGSEEPAGSQAGDDVLDGEDPELLLVTSDVDLHVTLIGEATSLASLGQLQPIGRKKGQTARAMKAVATHAAQQPATAKANRGFQAASRWASRSETDR